jgi:hypothetical protein
VHSSYRVKFDVPKIIEHFGGVSGSVQALKLVGIDMKPKTIQKQRERGNAPAELVASLMLASARAGNPMDPYQFLLEKTE